MSLSSRSPPSEYTIMPGVLGMCRVTTRRAEEGPLYEISHLFAFLRLFEAVGMISDCPRARSVGREGLQALDRDRYRGTKSLT
jgi:hypothetical protein